MGAWFLPSALFFLLGVLPSTAEAGGACDPAVRQSLRRDLEEGRLPEALEKVRGIDDSCLRGEDLWELALGLERVGRSRDALGYYRRLAAAYDPAKRARFLEGKERALRWAPPCLLTLLTTPGGSRVLLDSREVGRTTPGPSGSIDLREPGGPHRIAVEHEGRRSHEEPISLEYGEPLKLQLTLEKEKENEVGGAGFVGAFAGPSWTSYGDPRLEAGVAIEAGLDGGYLFFLRKVPWLALHLHATFIYTPVLDDATKTTASFLSFFGGGGARLRFSRVFVDLRFSAGVALFVGASEKAFLFDRAAAPSPLALAALRPALGVGLAITRGLTLTLYPFALDVLLPTSTVRSSIPRILRYEPTLVLGWQS
jgi:hypothetical protein